MCAVFHRSFSSWLVLILWCWCLFVSHLIRRQELPRNAKEDQPESLPDYLGRLRGHGGCEMFNGSRLESAEGQPLEYFGLEAGAYNEARTN